MAIDPKMVFMDERLRLNSCVYCGGNPETREHVPPKIFLDRPHPEDLYVISACRKCNNSKSSEEEYLSCLLECIVCGTTDISGLEREKIKKALLHSPKLQSKIEAAKQITSNSIIWAFDQDRVNDLAIKLAQGHMAYEAFAMGEEPAQVYINPLCTLPTDMQDLFGFEDSYTEMDVWPEIGSRGFLRALVAGESAFSSSWIDVQPNRYRYKIIQPSAVAIVIREYLGIYVAWE